MQMWVQALELKKLIQIDDAGWVWGNASCDQAHLNSLVVPCLS